MTTLLVSWTQTSPAAAGSAAYTGASAIGQYAHVECYADLQGATGGTLDVYIQASPDGGTTWYDYAHFAQLTAGAAAVQYRFAASRYGPLSKNPIIDTIGSGTSPVLAAGTIVGGSFGIVWRLLFVAGAGTSAGASQTVRAYFYKAADGTP